MKKQRIIDFFDKYAADWDKNCLRKEDILTILLDNADIHDGIHVLDIACGTGVLFPDYLKRNVSSITAIDISPEMVKAAKHKYNLENINIICGDAEIYDFHRQFDTAMIFNAFPHFLEPEKIIKSASRFLKPGGRFCVAHDMGRLRLDMHHSHEAAEVSIPLLPENELAALMDPYFNVDVIISNDDMYEVSGIKRSLLF